VSLPWIEGREIQGDNDPSDVLRVGEGVLIGGILSDMFSLRLQFYVMGVLTTLSLIITLLLLPEEVSPAGEISRHLLEEFWATPCSGLSFYRVVAALGMGSIMGFLPL
jgi:predicted MFS family arabinose efflux permease